MSRLDTEYFRSRGFLTWGQAYAEAGKALARPPRTFKNLRDEFDPVHSNSRQGWHQRPTRPDRQRVLDDLHSISNDALKELVDRILNRDVDATAPAIDALARIENVAANVAERLLTGRRAEEYFLANCEAIVNVPRSGIEDVRQNACGYDFSAPARPGLAIEVKGLTTVSGHILFTDREWTEAKMRQDHYLLVVVGNLAHEPRASLISNPWTVLAAKCAYRQSFTAEWHARVSVA